MANKKEVRQMDNLPIRGKMNPVAATSDEGRINGWAEDLSDHSRNYKPNQKARRAKPRRKDHK